jgi:glutamate dehydrogenase
MLSRIIRNSKIVGLRPILASSRLIRPVYSRLNTKPVLTSFRHYSAFLEKPQQIRDVENYITDKNLIPADLIKQEINSFYNSLGIDDMYFQQETVEGVGEHIISLYGAKIQAFVNNENAPEISLKRATETGAVYIHTSKPGQKHPKGYELRIDQNYLDVSNDKTAFRLESYLSKSKEIMTQTANLRCYLIRQCDFVVQNPTENEKHDINLVSDKNFLFRTTKETQTLFQTIMNEVQETDAPAIYTVDNPKNSSQKRLIIGFKRKTTNKFFSALTDVFHFHGLNSTKKFVDQFSNGVTICSFYLENTAKNFNRPIERSIQSVMEEANLIYCLPENQLIHLVQSHSLSVTESVYANVGWLFAQHFVRKLGSEYIALTKIVNMENEQHVFSFNVG